MPTLAQSAYRLLREDILRGRLEPGQKLGLEQLKARYGLSFSPLREAMNRLEAERLLVSAAARGFTVAPISSEELWDTIDVRLLVETEALRRSIAQGDDGWEKTLVASFHGLELQYRRVRSKGDGAADEDYQTLEQRHHDFHAALLAACGSPRLLLLFEQFYTETQRYRLPVLNASGQGAARDLAAEHRALMEASLDRDADRAAALLDSHYRMTAARIDPVLSATERNAGPAR